MATKTLKNLKQVDGRLDDAQRARLNELLNPWGDQHGYKQTDPVKYETELSQMDLADLHAEAIKRGLVAHHSRGILIKNLVREMQMKTSSFRGQIVTKEYLTPAAKKKIEKLMKV